MKLNTKAKMEGAMCLSANQKPAVSLTIIDDGSLISMINNVNAMANTASQKASSLKLRCSSAIRGCGAFAVCIDVVGSILPLT